MIIPDKLIGNCTERDETLDENFKFIMDDRILPGINSPNAPVALQLAMIPIGCMKEVLNDANNAMDKSVRRYGKLRDEILEALEDSSELPLTSVETVDLVHKLMMEVNSLYAAHDIFVAQVKLVRSEVLSQLKLFTNNEDVIIEQMDYLEATDRMEHALRSYGIQLSTREYQTLEEVIDTALRTINDVILSAVQHFLDIFDKYSPAYSSLLLATPGSEEESGNSEDVME